MADAITTVMRPVPWDGSFTPLPRYPSQPSQLPKTERVNQYLCDRCRAFSTQLEATQRLKFKFEKTWVKDVRIRFLGKYIKSFSFFSVYETWTEFYESYAKGCHLCSIAFLSLSQGKDSTVKKLNEERHFHVANVRFRWRMSRSGEQIPVEPQVHVGDSIIATGSPIVLEIYPCAWCKCRNSAFLKLSVEELS
jgi:hypothetical protein